MTKMTLSPFAETITADGSNNLVSSNPTGTGGLGYTPIFRENFSSGVSGAAYTTGSWADSSYDNTRADTGTLSMKMVLDQGQPPAICGGNNFFGGTVTLADPIPIGKTVWFSAKFFFPSTFSWGYTYSSSDSAEAATCGKGTDGFGLLKFMRLAPTNGTSRIYLQPPVDRRSVSQPTSNTMRITSEVGPLVADLNNANGKIGLNAWVTCQIAVKVASDGTGFIRYWNGDNFIGEVTGATVTAANSIASWTIGDYWNGIPYTDGGAGRDEFWMDEVILATDVDGYGEPTTTDSGGRPYISSTTKVSDF